MNLKLLTTEENKDVKNVKTDMKESTEVLTIMCALLLLTNSIFLNKLSTFLTVYFITTLFSVIWKQSSNASNAPPIT